MMTTYLSLLELLLLCTTPLTLQSSLTYSAADVLFHSLQGKDNYSRCGLTKGSMKDVYTDYFVGEVKTYRPDLLRELRHHFGVSETLYKQCMNSQFLECVYADSKSGQTFWRSTDGTLIVKTIKRYECQNLRNMIDSYAQHVQGDHSCLSGVLGVYRIRLKKQGRRFRYFLVTRSVFSKSVGPSVPDRGYVPQYLTAPYTESNTNGMRFDLKGSTYGRRKSASSNVLKDLDLLNLPSASLGELGFAKPILMRALQRDVTFLQSHRLMDYSLLVEVERADASHYHKRFHNRIVDPVSTSMKDRGKLALLGSNGQIYHFGIIDFLQKYTCRKYLETFIKGLFVDWKTISCVSPPYYAERMVEFIDRHTA